MGVEVWLPILKFKQKKKTIRKDKIFSTFQKCCFHFDNNEVELSYYISAYELQILEIQPYILCILLFNENLTNTLKFAKWFHATKTYIPIHICPKRVTNHNTKQR